MGSLRVGHNWATSLSLFTLLHWRRKWQPTPVFLSGESQGRGILVGCRLWVAQSQTRLKRLGSSSSSIFSYACWPSLRNVWEIFEKIFRSSVPYLIGLFFFFLMCYMNRLYILNIDTLSVISFSNIFSHSVSCLFVLLCKSLVPMCLFLLCFRRQNHKVWLWFK